ncbi:copper resistance CopC family protein [Thermoactinospora rubra]|uniref:copper resistance CopC family protein n=1 Tax=Thermoactinospora rubra TaxID=1088767 RepID=UPI000A10D5FF|nr:copper resistance CopC family protein [Thermoactinospora rubra]
MKRSPLAVLTALLAALVVLGTAAPALAHDALKDSDPKKGSTVGPVEEVSLEFTARVRMPYVFVRDAAGGRFEQGEPRVDGKVVTQELKGALPDGKYTVAYRVISSDGHPIEGEIPFTVKGAPKAEQTPEQTPEQIPTETSSPARTPTQAAEQSPAAAEARQEDGGGFPVWLLIVVGGLVGIGIGFLISARRVKP